MNLLPEKERLPQIILVLSGFLFIGLIYILAKVLGDSPLVPIIFVVGWILLMGAALKSFVNSFRKNKNKL